MDLTSPTSFPPGGADALIAPARDTVEHRLQRALLLELLNGQRSSWHDITALAARLREQPGSIRSAAAALAAAGLARIDRDTVCATPTAAYFDALWPIVI